MFNFSISPEILYFLSRVVAFLHLLYVLLVFLGLFAIYIGYLFKLKFVHNIYFRVIHLLAMVIVAIQQYFMINCPLTILEKRLLHLAGKPTYSGAFVANIMDKYQLNISTHYYFPLYATLSALFIISFLVIPPRIKTRKS